MKYALMCPVLTFYVGHKGPFWSPYKMTKQTWHGCIFWTLVLLSEVNTCNRANSYLKPFTPLPAFLLLQITITSIFYLLNWLVKIWRGLRGESQSFYSLFKITEIQCTIEKYTMFWCMDKRVIKLHLWLSLSYISQTVQ